MGRRATQNSNFFRVAPGSPNNSYIVMKMEGDPRIFGGRMPRGGPPFLPQAEIDPIRAWISMGALDN